MTTPAPELLKLPDGRQIEFVRYGASAGPAAMATVPRRSMVEELRSGLARESPAKRGSFSCPLSISCLNDNLPTIFGGCASYGNVTDILSSRNMPQQIASKRCSKGTTE